MSTRSSEDLNSSEIAQLLLLNQKLADAEKWILDRGEKSLQHYRNIDGQLNARSWDSGHPKRWRIRWDAKLSARIALILKKDDPDYSDEHDNILLNLHWDVLSDLTQPQPRIYGRSHDWNRLWDIRRDDKLSGQPLCRLFHDLCWKTLHDGYDIPLRIGELWIDLILTQKQDIQWNAIATQLHQKDAFSVEESKQLHDLNAWLIKTEDFVIRHSRSAYKGYLGYGGKERAQISDDVYEDVEIESEITYAFGDKHPGFDEQGDNVIAQIFELYIEGSGLFDKEFREMDHREEGGPEGFKHCWLFHDLTDHHDLSWDDTLSVGQIWTDVHLIQQRIVQWSPSCHERWHATTQS